MFTAEGLTNRLIHEASPYLQQHAHNPVDWYPWGNEALQQARAEDKPIFLGVGYSACHWCHGHKRYRSRSKEERRAQRGVNSCTALLLVRGKQNKNRREG